MDKSKNVAARPGDAERPQESGAAAPGRGGRMSRQRKMTAVLRLVRGEDLELVFAFARCDSRDADGMA